MESAEQEEKAHRRGELVFGCLAREQIHGASETQASGIERCSEWGEKHLGAREGKGIRRLTTIEGLHSSETFGRRQYSLAGIMSLACLSYSFKEQSILRGPRRPVHPT